VLAQAQHNQPEAIYAAPPLPKHGLVPFTGMPQRGRSEPRRASGMLKVHSVTLMLCSESRPGCAGRDAILSEPRRCGQSRRSRCTVRCVSRCMSRRMLRRMSRCMSRCMLRCMSRCTSRCTSRLCAAGGERLHRLRAQAQGAPSLPTDRPTDHEDSVVSAALLGRPQQTPESTCNTPSVHRARATCNVQE
jgi:hypothetical protein